MIGWSLLIIHNPGIGDTVGDPLAHLSTGQF